MVRIDYIFSYWIFFWYLLYICKLVKYNPKFAIICALIENIVTLMFMLYYKTKQKTILLYIILNFILKIIPLFTIRNTKIKINDIYFSIILFILYLFWIKMNVTNVFINYKKKMIFNDEYGPGMKTIEKIIL